MYKEIRTNGLTNKVNILGKLLVSSENEWVNSIEELRKIITEIQNIKDIFYP